MNYKWAVSFSLKPQDSEFIIMSLCKEPDAKEVDAKS